MSARELLHWSPYLNLCPEGLVLMLKKQDLGINPYVPNNGSRDQSLTGIGGPRVYVSVRHHQPESGEEGDLGPSAGCESGVEEVLLDYEVTLDIEALAEYSCHTGHGRCKCLTLWS